MATNVQNFGSVVRLKWLAADPANPENGMMYYNTATNKFRVYENAAWKDSSSSEVDLSAYLKHDGSVPLSGNLVPDTDGSRRLGSLTKQFNHIYQGTGFYGGDTSINRFGITSNNGNGFTITTSGNVLNLVGSSVEVYAPLNMKTVNKIINLADPQNAQDAATKNSVEVGLATKLSLSGGSMSGNIAMGNNKIIGLGAPANPTDAARLIDVQSALSGLDWQSDVLDIQVDNTLVPSLVEGARYIITNAASLNAGFGVIAGVQDNDIVEYDGAEFVVAYDVSSQGEGALVWDQASDTFQRYNGVDWSEFGGLAGITAGIGLTKSGNTLSVNLGAGIAQLPTDEVGVDLYSSSALMLTVDGTTDSTATAAQLSLRLDGPTLSKSASGVKVAVGGISNSEVAVDAAIDYSKLASLSTGAPKALVSDTLGFVSESAVTATELGYLAGVTSSVQTQLSDKANVTLGNLGTTAINADLLTDGQFRKLGDATGKGFEVAHVGSYRSFANSTNVAAASLVTGETTITPMFGMSPGILVGGTVYHAAFPDGQTTITSVGADDFVVADAPESDDSNATLEITYDLSVRSLDDVSGLRSGSAFFRSGNTTTAQSGEVLIRSGNTQSGDSGEVGMRSGNSSSGGVTGDFYIRTGNTSGARGIGRLDARHLDLRSDEGIFIDNNAGAISRVANSQFELAPSVGSLTDVDASLQFDAANSKSVHVQYELLNASNGDVRTGTLMVAAGNVAAGRINLTDVNSRTHVSMDAVEFSAVLNTGTGIWKVQYTNSGSDSFTMKALSFSAFI